MLNTIKLGLIRLSVCNSVFNVKRRNNQLLYASKITNSRNSRISKEETEGYFIIEIDKNTMKWTMEIKQGALSFDVKNSTASFLGFRKKLYKPGKYTSQKFIDIISFSTINIHCNVISGVEDKSNNADILYTFTLREPPGYLINIIPTNILYQNVKKDRIEYFYFHIKDEQGGPFDFNGDVLSFTLHLI